MQHGIRAIYKHGQATNYREGKKRNLSRANICIKHGCYSQNSSGASVRSCRGKGTTNTTNTTTTTTTFEDRHMDRWRASFMPLSCVVLYSEMYSYN